MGRIRWKKEREGTKKREKRTKRRSNRTICRRRMSKYEERKGWIEKRRWMKRRRKREDRSLLTSQQNSKFLFSTFVHATHHTTFHWTIDLSFTQSPRSHNGVVTDTLPAKVWANKYHCKYHSEAKLFDPSASVWATQVSFKPFKYR
jgi:hypothetical protein